MTISPSRPHPREFRQRLINREPLLGTFLKTPTSHAAEIIGSIGYDYVMFDEEHAPWTRASLEVGFLGAIAAGTASIVRIARPDAASVLSALDDGAIGIMVPHVTSGEKARDVASWARYRGGTRGSGTGRLGDFVARNGTMEDHYDFCDATTAVIAMIEDREALDHIDDITSVAGIDAIFMGRGDLGLSLSNATGPAPTLQEAVRIIAESAARSGKTLSAVVPSLTSDDAREMIDLGVTAMMVGNDQGFLRAAAAAQYDQFKQVMRA